MPPKHDPTFVNARIGSTLARFGSVTSSERARLLERDGNVCVWCGEDDRTKLQLDHVIPRSHGGKEHDDNLQSLCARCNRLKWNGIFGTSGELPLFPWMPIYADEFFRLATALPSDLLGALITLKMTAWQATPRCTLPNDDMKLSRLSGLGVRWGEAGDWLREYFVVIDNGARLLDQELFDRYQKQVELSFSRSLNGKKGGRPAKGGQTESNRESKPAPLASLLPAVVSTSSVSLNSSKRTKELETESHQTESKRAAWLSDPDNAGKRIPSDAELAQYVPPSTPAPSTP